MWHRWLAFSSSERSLLLQLYWSLLWIRLRLKFIRLDELICWAEAGSAFNEPLSRNEKVIYTSRTAIEQSEEKYKPRDNVRYSSSRRSDKVNSLLGSVCRFQGLSNVCLPRALVLCRSLNREGIPAKVRIGVATGDQSILSPANSHPHRNQPSLKAHAWVEVEGYSSDNTLHNYSRFENLQARRS